MKFGQSILIWVLVSGLGLPAIAVDPSRRLADLQPDPLLPNPNLDRPLSPLEQQSIQTEIERLNQEAEQALQNSQPELAFEQWFRALNLQRALGVKTELEGLTRVGEIAWKNGQKSPLQAITQRLNRIETELGQQQNGLTADYAALGLAYQKVRALTAAQNLYTTQLEVALKSGDRSAVDSILSALVQVSWGSLEYGLAAQYTQQQLEILQSLPATVENLNQERSLWEQLAFFAQQNHDYLTQSTAIETLIDLSLDLGLEATIPTLYLDLAQAQRQLGAVDPAIQSYTQAYQLAQEQEQLGTAQTILVNLGELQAQQGQWRSAIQTYETLRHVQRYSSNLLGLLDSYNRLGELYLHLQEVEQARQQFENGLELARRLQYKEAEFTRQIERL